MRNDDLRMADGRYLTSELALLVMHKLPKKPDGKVKELKLAVT